MTTLRTTQIRPMSLDDLPVVAAMRCADLVLDGEADWVRLMALAGEDCWVAQQLEKIVGTVVTIRYGRAFGWLGGLMVHAERECDGSANQTGRALVRQAVEHLTRWGVETIKADAPNDLVREVLQAEGFMDDTGLVCCQAHLDQFHERELIRPVQTMTAESLEAAATLDETVFGADRRQLLWRLHSEFPDGAFCFRDAAGHLRGFLMARPSSQAWRLGPWVALSDEIALNLLYQALGHIGTDQTLEVIFPTRCTGAGNVLEPFDFRSVSHATRHVRGPNLRPGHPERMYGIAGFDAG